ncbi:hypothetical protein AX16_001382 [Volvariella volvacea WC 439]|nr:hypothetical protein AX16_001382 [Volvariella volvacea WC 439]
MSSALVGRIRTKLTALLGIRTPVVSAPMAGASGGALAAQTTLGGGFGFLAAGYDPVERFTSELATAKEMLKPLNADRLPIGIGFLGWQLEKPDSPSPQLLSIALESGVRAVWFAFGRNLGHWIEIVGQHDQKTQSKTLVFVQVNSLEEASVALNTWKADVIVAQGNESGGHGSSTAPPLLTLVPAILALTPRDGPPILGAGGLANGSQIASVLSLGAAGVVLGTRFLLSPESRYTKAQMQAIIDANLGSTVRTMAFDHARGTLGWPDGIDGRALRNLTVDDFERNRDTTEIRQEFQEAVRNDDPTRMLVWGGTGVGLMNKILPAKEIVEELHRECVDTLRATSDLLVDIRAGL